MRVTVSTTRVSDLSRGNSCACHTQLGKVPGHVGEKG